MLNETSKNTVARKYKNLVSFASTEINRPIVKSTYFLFSAVYATMPGKQQNHYHKNMFVTF